MMVIDRIGSPKDLKLLTMKELKRLCEEIREFLIRSVCRTGGHLASNLGVVELTVALHYVFDSPRDKIIWDVGHQCYPHKIITGRRGLFQTLRQYGGISGFPSRKESPHDVFDTGHASNSISVALGISEAKNKKGEDFKVICVIGDGALSGGQAFEALNHAGHLKSDILVVLNDNEMSISKSIGALSSYLGRIMTNEHVMHARERIKERIRQIPALGGGFYKIAKHTEELVKGLLGPGILFEELGFRYVGPIDGHNVEALVETMKNVKRLREPVLLHVVTKKGKGLLEAENDPAMFHGISNLEVEGEGNEGVTFSEIFGDTIIELAQMDNRVVAITAAMALGTGLEKYSKLYPERFYDVGICEAHAVTFAAGLSTQGFRPFVAIYSTFLQRAYDQIVTDVCLQELPVVFVVDRAGIVGGDGPTHHGAFDLSYLRHIPNMVLMVPKDGNELRRMLYTALQCGRPCAIRYPKGRARGVYKGALEAVQLGTWEVIRRGGDVCLIACGNLVELALDVAQELDEEGISVMVVNGRFVKPVDDSILAEAASTGWILTLEENARIGGLGGAVLESLADSGRSCKVKVLGLPDRFIPHGSQEQLRREVGLSKEEIKSSILAWLKSG